MRNSGWILLFILSAASCTRSIDIHKKAVSEPEIHHDPNADFKQLRGQTHDRTYLKRKLAPLHLNIDSLQDVVDNLNQNTADQEWEYQISTLPDSPGQILRFYKSHKNADGSKGRTIYGEENNRSPYR